MNLPRKLGWVAFLALLFVVDDVLVYALFRNLSDWQVHPLLLGSGVSVVLLLNVLLALAVVRVLSRRPTTGAEGMVGRLGVVRKAERRHAWVEVRGETWRAVSRQRLRVGEEVVVVAVDGLTLEVRPLRTD